VLAVHEDIKRHYFDFWRIFKSKSFINMNFAKKQLQKYGWKEGWCYCFVLSEGLNILCSRVVCFVYEIIFAN